MHTLAQLRHSSVDFPSIETYITLFPPNVIGVLKEWQGVPGSGLSRWACAGAPEWIALPDGQRWMCQRWTSASQRRKKRGRPKGAREGYLGAQNLDVGEAPAVVEQAHTLTVIAESPPGGVIGVR